MVSGLSYWKEFYLLNGNIYTLNIKKYQNEIILEYSFLNIQISLPSRNVFALVFFYSSLSLLINNGLEHAQTKAKNVHAKKVVTKNKSDKMNTQITDSVMSSRKVCHSSIYLQFRDGAEGVPI